LFATRADGTVCMNTITIVSGEAVRHQTWSGWKELPGLVSDASPAVLCDGELWLFVKGPGNAISFNRGNPQ